MIEECSLFYVVSVEFGLESSNTLRNEHVVSEMSGRCAIAPEGFVEEVNGGVVKNDKGHFVRGKGEARAGGGREGVVGGGGRHFSICR